MRETSFFLRTQRWTSRSTRPRAGRERLCNQTFTRPKVKINRQGPFAHFNPQHSLLCHMGLYYFEFEFERKKLPINSWCSARGEGGRSQTETMRNPGERGKQRTGVLRKGAKPDPPSKTYPSNLFPPRHECFFLNQFDPLQAHSNSYSTVSFTRIIYYYRH